MRAECRATNGMMESSGVKDEVFAIGALVTVSKLKLDMSKIGWGVRDMAETDAGLSCNQLLERAYSRNTCRF